MNKCARKIDDGYGKIRYLKPIFQKLCIFWGWKKMVKMAGQEKKKKRNMNIRPKNQKGNISEDLFMWTLKSQMHRI